MKITNKYGLPEQFVRVVSKHTHKSADYSATQLLRSPRQLLLERRHDDEIVVDVSDRLWAMFGTAVHSVAEQAALENELTELYMEAPMLGVTVSGTCDLYNPDEKIIYDFKNTSVWSIVYNSREKEWEQQLNIYAWLLRTAHGYEAHGARIIAFLRDWSATKAETDPSYPQSQALVIPVRVWAEEDAMWFVNDRVRLHQEAKDLADADLPFCTDEERWVTETVWAVKKGNNKKAVRGGLFKDAASAYEFASKAGSDHHVEMRQGEPRRCDKYCPAKPFCNQRQRELGGGK